MTVDKVVGIGAALVTVALVTTIVAHPASVQIVNSLANGFIGAIKAAQGR